MKPINNVLLELECLILIELACLMKILNLEIALKAKYERVEK